MSGGKVIFTDNFTHECSRIKQLSEGYSRKFYVYGKDFKDRSIFQEELNDFIFIEINRIRCPEFIFLFTQNTPKDFFVIKYPRIRDIMNRDIEMLQTFLKGYKLIIEIHPFLGNKDVFWCYFLWSFFNKSLLGYPHSYAFKGAKVINGIDPFDCNILAHKISSETETTIGSVFDNIKIERIALDIETHHLYQELKKTLFETEKYPFKIIKKLKNFINTRDVRLKKGFNLLNLNTVFNHYLNGERSIFVSNAKVDQYLESEFFNYTNNVNLFMKTLYDDKIK